MKFEFVYKSRLAWVSLVAAAVLALAGCAGTNFIRPEPSSFVLGKTAQQDILQRMGQPYQTGTMEKNGKILQVASYAFAHAGREALYEGVTPGRAQGFYFLDGILVGAEFSSSFKSDGTDFDETKLAQLEKGKSTQADVIRLFGPAGGNYIAPLTTDSADGALVYVYSQTKGSAFSLHFYHKTLIVSYDKSGVIVDIQYTAQGNKN
jgi:outer membrane protein assembly factor BamE (lipoprotein component of BamABCDE complex)